jgi:hypothetical protein
MRYLLFCYVVISPTIGFDACITGTDAHETEEIQPTDSIFFFCFDGDLL